MIWVKWSFNSPFLSERFPIFGISNSLGSYLPGALPAHKQPCPQWLNQGKIRNVELSLQIPSQTTDTGEYSLNNCSGQKGEPGAEPQGNQELKSKFLSATGTQWHPCPPKLEPFKEIFLSGGQKAAPSTRVLLKQHLRAVWFWYLKLQLQGFVELPSLSIPDFKISIQ